LRDAEAVNLVNDVWHAWFDYQSALQKAFKGPGTIEEQEAADVLEAVRQARLDRHLNFFRMVRFGTWTHRRMHTMHTHTHINDRAHLSLLSSA
jgi:ribulose bisphosphate carboxylase small subunit